ncbi:MAG: hypothetical protein CHACPFDD_00833 [Phycisphaerae bacterium]|nr:hypothetical protein [Phycisphaerae bacterium]
MRHAAGLAALPADEAGDTPFGIDAGHWRAVRRVLQAIDPEQLLPGELAACAFVYRMEPGGSDSARLVGLVRRHLSGPRDPTIDDLERIVALDWCWEALPPELRSEFVMSRRLELRPLRATDSALEARAFRASLEHVALARVVEDSEVSGTAWAAARAAILEAAIQYRVETLPRFVALRGLSPSGSAAGPEEELSAALAVELCGGLVMEADPWQTWRGSVGRWLEHYALADLGTAGPRRSFLHDDGDEAPLLPAPRWERMLPLTAHLIAARSGDPAAALVAQRVEAAMAAEPGRDAWRWIPIAFPSRALKPCAPPSLPLARNLEGAIVMRSPDAALPFGVWIETGQACARRGQHFDAGHFVVHGGDVITQQAGDDVALDAAATRGGGQHLGRAESAAALDQFAHASIAHNCLILFDQTQAQRWCGQDFAPRGGQRPIERTCTDFGARAPETGGGRVETFGARGDFAYVRLDLTAAYDRRQAEQYTREFLFCRQRVLFVIDRIRPGRGGARPCSVMILPTRPRIGREMLARGQQLAGSSDDAGIWRVDPAEWVVWRRGADAAWYATVSPATREVRVVGGPGRPQRVENGPFRGREYVGGAADGFERLVVPSAEYKPQNAWYQLGTPTGLGAEFARTPTWGRVETYLAPGREEALLIAALVLTSAHEATAPSIAIESGAPGATTAPAEVVRIVLRSREVNVLLELPRGAAGGAIVSQKGEIVWRFPLTVEPTGMIDSR